MEFAVESFKDVLNNVFGAWESQVKDQLVDALFNSLHDLVDEDGQDGLKSRLQKTVSTVITQVAKMNSVTPRASPVASAVGAAAKKTSSAKKTTAAAPTEQKCAATLKSRNEQCSKTGKNLHEGKMYCAQHNPVKAPKPGATTSTGKKPPTKASDSIIKKNADRDQLREMVNKVKNADAGGKGEVETEANDEDFEEALAEEVTSKKQELSKLVSKVKNGKKEAAKPAPVEDDVVEDDQEDEPPAKITKKVQPARKVKNAKKEVSSGEDDDLAGDI